MKEALVENSNSVAARRQPVAQGKSGPASSLNNLAAGVNNSPAMTAQLVKMQGLFGTAAQLRDDKSGAVLRVEEEEPLQGKFEPVQRVEEEEPLQGKFEPVQRAEEEEPLQGKFEPVQRVEEEEPLQGKFEPVQRVEEEEPLQGKFEPVQRVEEEEPLQGKFEPVQRVEEEEPLQGKFASGSSAQLKEDNKKPNNTGLPDNLKNGIEALSGMSMDAVRVHYDSARPAQLNALAYAQGTDIHVAPGQERHLPHEAWHVVQQAKGRVKPTVQMKGGVPVNDDPSLEREADVMGHRAMAADRGKAAEPAVVGLGAGQPVQRLVVYGGDANPPEDVNIVMTLPNVVASVGGPVCYHNQNPKYGEHDRIALLSHGDQGTIGWRGGDWNGKRLVDDELMATVPPIKQDTYLEIWSCSAGERTAGKNDSLIDAVTANLNGKVANVTVKGVKGQHIVLNDRGDHYVPKAGTPEFGETFSKLRNYYLWLYGFFSMKLVTSVLGGFKQERVGVGKDWHPVLRPNDMGKADDLIFNLKDLYGEEQKCGGIGLGMDYETFLEGRKASWQKMCSFLRGNRAFRAVTEQVGADWLELKSS